ncbi:MAG: hypothetical protein ACRCT1_17690, partial [Microcoleaceae cyanobacterium]
MSNQQKSVLTQTEMSHSQSPKPLHSQQKSVLTQTPMSPSQSPKLLSNQQKSVLTQTPMSLSSRVFTGSTARCPSRTTIL